VSQRTYIDFDEFPVFCFRHGAFKPALLPSTITGHLRLSISGRVVEQPPCLRTRSDFSGIGHDELSSSGIRERNRRKIDNRGTALIDQRCIMATIGRKQDRNDRTIIIAGMFIFECEEHTP